VLANLAAQFPRLSLDSQKRVMLQVIREITLNTLSAHLFLLRVEWQKGIAVRPDIALIWRGKEARIGYQWTPEEEAALRATYSDQSQLEIMRALPRRVWQSIREHASGLGLRRVNYATDATGVNPYHATMSYDDLEAVANLVTDPQQQERVREVANSLARKTAPGGLSAHWWLPLDLISYAGSAAIQEDTDILFSEILLPVSRGADSGDMAHGGDDFIESVVSEARR
jgi:hypothetical protein